jgi:hypothetical protein
MARLRLQIRLVVGCFYYGISLVHVYAYAYLNPHPLSARKGRSFLPRAAVGVPSVNVPVPVPHGTLHRHSQHVLFSAPIPTDGDIPVPNDVDVDLDLDLHLDLSSLSLQDLISRLDERNIRYSPTSTRKDLEALLQQLHSQQQLLLEQTQAPKSQSGTFQSAADPVTTCTDVPNPPTFDEVSVSSASASSPQKRQSRGQRRPIQDMLQELDAQSIRYPPTASRDDLEWLLANANQHHRSTEDKDRNNAPSAKASRTGTSNSNMPSNSNMNTADPSSQARNVPIPIADLLRELDERNIRYPPTATRLDLEELFQRITQEQRQTEIPPLIETELERDPIIQGNDTQELGKQKPPPGVYEQQQEQKQASSPPKRQSRQARRPIADLLRELDERNIRYPPTATRLDLEELLVQRTSVEGNGNYTQELWQQQQQQQPPAGVNEQQQLTPRARRRAKSRKQQEQSPWRTILRQGQKVIPVAVWETLPKTIASTTSRTVNRAARKARRVSRQAVELFTVDVDEDGVRDVDYEYLYKEERIPKLPVDVTAQRITTEETELHPKRRRGPRDPLPTPPKRRQRDRDRPARSRPVRTRSSRGVTPPPPQNQPQPPLQTAFLLPPSTKLDGNSNHVSPKSEQQDPRKPPRSARREATSKRPKRRIYSPYKEESSTLEDDRDVVDRFGDFFADAADRVLWDDYDGSATPKKRSNANTKKKSAASSKNKTEARHWKDRLEEQFDSMLGIHEDGGFYNKWEQQMGEDRRNEGGNDAFSVAQGRKPKPSGVFGRRRKYDKPIWEEEGNLISLLFGRSSSGGSLLFERLLDHNSGSLLNFFESVFRSFLLVASYVSRWATVRGAIPQPLVVFGLISAGICARPRRRLRTIVITLLALRTAGELVHGYVYGEQGWEDEEDFEDEDEDVDLQGGERV